MNIIVDNNCGSSYNGKVKNILKIHNMDLLKNDFLKSYISITSPTYDGGGVLCR